MDGSSAHSPADIKSAGRADATGRENLALQYPPALLLLSVGAVETI
jgi:hypothetical protein